MPEQTFLAFDFGLKKIGVAIGNSLTKSARPLCILRPATKQARFEQIAQLLNEWQPDCVIVGLPLTLEGQEQPASLQSRRFANQLNGRFAVKVELVDERGASREAQSYLGNNHDDDAGAASIILQRYLDKLA